MSLVAHAATHWGGCQPGGLGQLPWPGPAESGLTSGLYPWPLPGTGRLVSLATSSTPTPPRHTLHGLSIATVFPCHLVLVLGSGLRPWDLWSSGCCYREAHVGGEGVRLGERSDLWTCVRRREAGTAGRVSPGQVQDPSHTQQAILGQARLCPLGPKVHSSSHPDPRPFVQVFPHPRHLPRALPAWLLPTKGPSQNAGWCVTMSGQDGCHKDVSQRSLPPYRLGAPPAGMVGCRAWWLPAGCSALTASRCPKARSMWGSR